MEASAERVLGVDVSLGPISPDAPIDLRRFFGITPSEADSLGTRAWQPGAGGQSADIEYDAFIPTSQQTGFALALSYGKLFGGAGSSPLVSHFGSTRQVSETLAFVYHF